MEFYEAAEFIRPSKDWLFATKSYLWILTENSGRKRHARVNVFRHCVHGKTVQDAQQLRIQSVITYVTMTGCWVISIMEHAEGDGHYFMWSIVPARTEEHQEALQSDLMVFGLKFNTGTFLIRRRCAIYMNTSTEPVLYCDGDEHVG
jgi:hypothetical protein